MPQKLQELPKKPNILFIMADDIGWFNVSAYNLGIMGYRYPKHRFAWQKKGLYSQTVMVNKVVPRDGPHSSRD